MVIVQVRTLAFARSFSSRVSAWCFAHRHSERKVVVCPYHTPYTALRAHSLVATDRYIFSYVMRPGTIQWFGAMYWQETVKPRRCHSEESSQAVRWSVHFQHLRRYFQIGIVILWKCRIRRWGKWNLPAKGISRRRVVWTWSIWEYFLEIGTSRVKHQKQYFWIEGTQCFWSFGKRRSLCVVPPRSSSQNRSPRISDMQEMPSGCEGVLRKYEVWWCKCFKVFRIGNKVEWN